VTGEDSDQLTLWDLGDEPGDMAEVDPVEGDAGPDGLTTTLTRSDTRSVTGSVANANVRL